MNSANLNLEIPVVQTEAIPVVQTVAIPVVQTGSDFSVLTLP